MNRKLFIDIIKDIEKAPTKFDIESWEDKQSPCGTTHCIAGKALVMHGFIFKETRRKSQFMAPWGVTYSTNAQVVDWAARMLDVPARKAEMLFYYDNWDEDLREKHENLSEQLRELKDAFKEAPSQRKKRVVFKQIKALREKLAKVAIAQTRRKMKEWRDVGYEN